MLTYFDDYPADLALSMALDAGANMDDIDRACGELRAKGAPDGVDWSTALFDAWTGEGERLSAAAASDEAQGHSLTSAEKYRRATVMYLTGERLPHQTYQPRHAAYNRMRECFWNYVRLSGANCEEVRVPYGESEIPALFVKAEGAVSAPTVVHFNGLDGVKEFLYLSGFGQALSKRGISVLFVDNPGVGEALRINGLHNSAEAEGPAGACLDYLETRDDVDSGRIAMAALSLGGYHAVRAVAFDPRFSACMVWGANYDWASHFRRRVEGVGSEPSVPHVFDHVKWVFGVDTIEECLALTDRFTLREILDRITVPIVIVHGEDDRQIPVADAYLTYEGCVNSPRRDLRIFTSEEGGEQHCQIGSMSLATDYLSDWAADVLVCQESKTPVGR